MSKITNPLGVVALFGFIGMIIGVFLGWTDFVGEFQTGLEIMTDNPMNYDYSFVPLATLILGVVGLIVSVLPMIKEGRTALTTSAVTALIGIIGIGLACLFMTGTDVFTELGNFAGQGLWLCMIGALTSAIGGLSCVFSLHGMDLAANAETSE